jgi:uncharacterized protein YndB with AHSA1/START domain
MEGRDTRRGTMSTMTKDVHLTSEEAVHAATGRTRADWFDALDSWNAAARTHRDIAAWLMAEHGLDNWWSQTLTVEYERARGLRPIGGGRDGLFVITVSKTVAVPAVRLFASVVDPAERERWLPDRSLRARPTAAAFTARFDWGTGGTRVVFGVVAKGADRSAVSLAHERLPSAEKAEQMKGFWRQRLAALKAVVED